MEKILFAVFTHENNSQGVSAPFLVTQNNCAVSRGPLRGFTSQETARSGPHVRPNYRNSGPGRRLVIVLVTF